MSSFFSSGSFLAQGNATTVIGKANSVTRLYSFHVISGASGGSVTLYDSADLVNPRMVMVGTASTGKNFSFGEKGVVFPGGLTDTNDANVTTVLFNISQ